MFRSYTGGAPGLSGARKRTHGARRDGSKPSPIGAKPSPFKHAARLVTNDPSRRTNVTYDVVIVGGGPGGLSAALALGRAKKRVLVCDAGPRRNAAAEHIQNFVTRDGTPPNEFRRIARADLARYPNVEVRDVAVESISGERSAFRVSIQSEVVDARRILLATGMVDEMLPIEGYRELWGRSIFQCPYCHGWEIKDTRWGYLPHPAFAAHLLPFAMQIRGWTTDVAVFTNGAFEIAPEVRSQLDAAKIRVETAPIARIVAREGRLEALALEGGAMVPRDALFSHPPQRQIDLVKKLGVELDEDGFVRADPMKRETSIPGIYAAGDLTTRMQAAIAAAASGTQAAAMINMELTMELVARGEL
ncbi:MAG: NAD(P)/FAD-dependent oxidoreductase [Polyangiaceae bacterium]|nr:NAD(P)/FAD-dependent oxidoreductase [Polyangiaceae bacterium]